MFKWKIPLGAAALCMLPGCDRLGGLQHPQQLTPDQLLTSHPHFQMPWGDGNLVLMEPSSSVLIFGLALLIFGMGVQLLRSAGGQRSRLWWGISLLLWGAGAFAAGVSYQAFAYELKAAGREVMAWTTWWEVNYLLLTTASINAMMMGVAYSTCGEVGRRRLGVYAVLNTLIYFVLCLTGAFLPDRFLVSFELMVLVTTPGYVVFFALNWRAYRQQRELLQWRLMLAWPLLALVMASYFAYLAAGFTEALWAMGWWFSANDVLHAGLILWMIWLQLRVVPLLKDRHPSASDGSIN